MIGIGFVIPMGPRRGRATIRTRSGRVVNQWMFAFIVWGMMLGIAVITTWLAYNRGIDSPDIWLVPVAALMAVSALGLVVALAVGLVSALRQLRGHEPREPWFTTSYDDEGAGPESWQIPKIW